MGFSLAIGEKAVWPPSLVVGREHSFAAPVSLFSVPICCPPISCRPFQTARRLKKKRCLSPRVRASRDPGGPVLGIADHLLYRWRVRQRSSHRSRDEIP